MNKFIVGIAFAVALAGPAYASGQFGLSAPSSQNLVVGAGQVAADGQIVRGSGFVVHHIRRGEYLIAFSPGYFPTGCAAMTVAGVGADTYSPIGEVVQQRGCGDYFHVSFYPPNSTHKIDAAFQFTAIED